MPYTEDTLVQQTTAEYADEVYRHVYRVYLTLPSPYYTAQAVA